MRAFIEGDFAGDSNTLRLRHAYGQWRRALFGQTWSTFSDPEAEPDGIDFEGLNAIVLFRQPQIRWSLPVGERSERLRSSASFGIVGIKNLDIQPDDALHLTRRSTINFMWSPIPRLDLVTEFLWGRRENKDGQHGTAAQTQVGSTFRF